MAFEQWFAFAIASAVLLAIPGPTILLVISYALGHGRKAASAKTASTIPARMRALRPAVSSVCFSLTGFHRAREPPAA